MSEGIVEEETDQQREGTAAHWTAERMLKDDVVFVGDQSPNGVIITDEMFEAALLYADDVRAISKGQEVQIEQQVSMPDIHPDCWGTPDACWFDLNTLTLYVWDLKFGHRRVDDWYQLLAYAVGALGAFSKCGPLGIANQHTRVVLTYIQPRCYDGRSPIQRMELPALDLRGYVNQMHAACGLADGAAAPITSGTHCRDCPAMHRCSVNLQAGSQFVEFSGTAIPHELTPGGLAYEMTVVARAEEAIKQRKEAINTEALSRIMSGQIVPGYTAEQGYGRNGWLRDNAEVIAMGDLLGANLRDERVKSPAQALTTFKKADIDPAVIASYYGKKPTAMKLVKVDAAEAQKAFFQSQRSK